MAASTIMETLDSTIQQELPALAIESLPGIDPIYNGMIRTTQNVVRDRGGRGWEVAHRFRTSISGMFEPRAATGGSAHATAVQSVRFGTAQNYPDPTKNQHVGNVTRYLGLNCHHGNFSLPLFLFKAEALSTVQFKTIADDLQGLAKLRAQLEAVSFYAPASGALGVLAAAGMTYDPGSNVSYKGKFTPTSSRIRWWVNGMLVDFFDDASGTNKINSLSGGTSDLPLVVDGVDYVDGTVTITEPTGTTYLDNSLLNPSSDDLDTTECYVFPRGAVQGGDDITDSGTLFRTGHYGIESWLINTGTLFGDAKGWNRGGNTQTAAFTIANYPQFKSFITPNLAAPLTDEVLNRKVGAMMDAYDLQIDTFITTRGVIDKHIKQSTLGPSRLNYDRTGKSANIKGGWSKVMYEYEGKEIDIFQSPYCQTGTLYGVKLGGGNLRRYVPPRAVPVGGVQAPGTGIDMGEEIEFIVPMAGGNSIFRLVTNSDGRVLDLVEAPFYQYSQVAPLDVRGIKIAGITESDFS